MNEVADNSVHLVVTSPPYWNLKDYGTENQIGFYQSYEDYINHLNLVWKECYRTLHDGCRLCINIGEVIINSKMFGRHKKVPIHQEITKFCEIMGFDYMGTIVWQKIGNSKGVFMGSYLFPRDGVIRLDYEYVLIFKKSGYAPRPTQDQKNQSKMTLKEWQIFFEGHWNFSGTHQNKGHSATYPTELPNRLIKMFSFVGETVLDPFVGSGTTTLAAQHNNRNSIGYEINKEYLDVIKEKLKVYQDSLWHTSVEFLEQGKTKKNFSTEISKLPYIFKDLRPLIGLKSKKNPTAQK